MIIEVIVMGLVVSAFLAVYLDEAIYSVASLAVTVILLSTLYFALGAIYVAIFQLSVGVGTLIALFLSGEMLSAFHDTSTGWMKVVIGIIAACLISMIAILGPPEVGTQHFFSETPLSTVLWNLRVIDVLAQGIVVLTIALGLVIILQERKEE